jgi:putative membrane protein
MKLLARFLLSVLSILLAAYIVPGIVVDGLYAAIIVAIILGALNLTVKPILFVLTLPITILTFGIFALVLNALILWFIGTFVQGFAVGGFLPALLGSIIISIVSWAGQKLLKDAKL